MKSKAQDVPGHAIVKVVNQSGFLWTVQDYVGWHQFWWTETQRNITASGKIRTKLPEICADKYDRNVHCVKHTLIYSQDKVYVKSFSCKAKIPVTKCQVDFPLIQKMESDLIMVPTFFLKCVNLHFEDEMYDPLRLIYV